MTPLQQFNVFRINGSTLRKSNAEALDGAWHASRAHLLQNSCQQEDKL
jgi:hypothetical protein